LLFGDGRTGRPEVREDVVAQRRHVAVAEWIGIGRSTAEAGHEGLFAHGHAIHAVQNGGNQVGRVKDRTERGPAGSCRRVFHLKGVRDISFR
jgi:hypothetical protein